MLKHKTTCDTGVRGSNLNTRSCLLPRGKMVIWDQESRGREWKFRFFNKDGKPTGRELHRLCERYHYINLLSAVINKTEYLAVSCWQCSKIWMINLEHQNEQPVVAYTGIDKEVGPICLSQTGTIYTVSYLSGKVSVLDCTRTKLTLKNRLPEIEEMKATHICYIATSDFLVLSSYQDHRICAVSSSGSIVWDIFGEIDNKKCSPSGMVYLSEEDLLLVGDRHTKRILVLSGTNGSWIQTLHPEKENFDVDDLHLINNELRVRYSPGLCSEVKLSHYLVSSAHTRYQYTSMPNTHN